MVRPGPESNLNKPGSVQPAGHRRPKRGHRSLSARSGFGRGSGRGWGRGSGRAAFQIAGRLEDIQPRGRVSPGAARQVGFAAYGLEHSLGIPAHLRGDLRQQQRSSPVPLHDDAMPPSHEFGRIPQFDQRLENRHFQLQGRQLRFGDRQKAGVIQGGRRRSLLNVLPEGDIEPHHPDAAAQLAVLMYGHECRGRRKKARAQCDRVERGLPIAPDGRLNRGPRQIEELSAVGLCELLHRRLPPLVRLGIRGRGGRGEWRGSAGSTGLWNSRWAVARLAQMIAATPALLGLTEADGAVRCVACAHRCLIRPGRAGICRVRENRDGRRVTTVFGQAVAANADPIEKKPLFHVYPGSVSFSIATRGCNFHCPHCQNWTISQADRGSLSAPVFQLPPEAVVAAALAAGSRSIAYTYTEPTVFIEYVAAR